MTFPYDVLLLRGSVAIEVQDDVVPEYALDWLAPFRGQPMAKITFTPEWARVLDFRTRFPSAMSA